MSEIDPEVARYGRRRHGQVDKLTSVVLGLSVAFALYNLRVLEKIGIVEKDAITMIAPAEQTTSTLSQQEREALYGAQKLFICQIPDENGVMRTIEVNIGGPETPLEVARLLETTDLSAYELLQDGVQLYNELDPQIPLRVDMSNEVGVRADNNKDLSYTQLWGVKDLMITSFQEQS